MAFVVEEVAVEQKRMGFTMKQITDEIPSDLGFITPSEGYKPKKSGEYRILMRALQITEDKNVSAKPVLNSEEHLVLLY